MTHFFPYRTLTADMSDQQFVLRWHYHESTLVHILPYFLDADILTDVTIAVENREIRAHKMVLAMCSVYFLQLFQELKCTHPVVVLHNVGFDEIKAVLSFMYKGQCVVSQDQLPSLLSVAKLLKIQGLCDMKVPEARQRISIPNESTEKLYEEEFNRTTQYVEQPENLEFKSRMPNNAPAEIKFDEHPAYKPADYFNDSAVVPLEPIPHCPYPRKCPIAVKEPRESSETCKCFLCGKYLSNQYNLRVHMETHEEAYHACQSCPHVSRSRDALRKHVSYRHPEEYHNRKRKKIDISQ
ncbi:unnamed protein product [Phyllotreta striolata]|uniref:Uncharacterized protein n=1 Tax=Phyllotreta striolata TaxID=444603 RepID=A0A9N9TYJ3_PHYSR|nr:unnamed protein product [Phyllotreta striolata]